jgi:demethylmenaquinone methyltransferase/2-methoxy-6-polyprenyl-1,4-benzoquinol methylase
MNHFRWIAPFYDMLLGQPDAGRLAELLRLPARGWLLDGGGGTGRASWPLRRLVGGVVVSDTCPEMLARARRKGMLAAGSRVGELPFADGRFDRVLVVDALHHFADPAQAIGDLVRVLRPGGRLVIEEFDLDRPAVKLLALAERLACMRSRFLRPREIRAMLAEKAVRVKIRTGRFGHAWIIGDKTG